MKIRIIILLLIVTALAACSSKGYSIMSYNVRNGKGLDGIVDFQRTADVINTYKPDFVALQELDSVTNRYGSTYALKEIASLANMNYTYAPAINFAGGKYGIGLLSKEEPMSVKRVPLPGREEKRMLLIAEFKSVIICCTHFSLTPADQLLSTDIVNSELLNMYSKYNGGKPIILAGDMNSHPDSDTQNQMLVHFKNLSGEKFTFPADNPTECLDYIYYFNPVKHRKLKARKGHVIADSIATIASDHRPVLLKFRSKKYKPSMMDGAILSSVIQ